MIRLKELREERKWSMRDAARFLNKPYTTYVNHEKEYREPDSEDLKAYAKAYDVSIDYLVGRTDIKKAVIQDDGNEQKRIKAMNLFDALPDSEKDNIISQLEWLAQRQVNQDH